MTDFLIAYSFYALLALLLLCTAFSSVASRIEAARDQERPSAYESHFPQIPMQQRADAVSPNSNRLKAGGNIQSR